MSLSVYFKEKPDYLEACLLSLDVQTLKANEVVLGDDKPISSDLEVFMYRFLGSLNIVSVPLAEMLVWLFPLNSRLLIN